MSWNWPPQLRYPGASITGLDEPPHPLQQEQLNGFLQPALTVAPVEVIGRRIQFHEPPEITQYWIDNEVRMFGKANWHPVDGMTGVIVDMPPSGTLGSGPKVRWDGVQHSDGQPVETWLGSVSRYTFSD